MHFHLLSRLLSRALSHRDGLLDSPPLSLLDYRVRNRLFNPRDSLLDNLKVYQLPSRQCSRLPTLPPSLPRSPAGNLLVSLQDSLRVNHPESLQPNHLHAHNHTRLFCHNLFSFPYAFYFFPPIMSI